MDNEFNLSEIRRWWIPGNHEVYKVVDDKQNILYRKYFFITYSDSGGLTYKEFHLIYNGNNSKHITITDKQYYSTNPADTEHKSIEVDSPDIFKNYLLTKVGYAGYYNDRWNTLADRKGTTYKPGDIFTQLTKSIVLYLVWYNVLLTEDGYMLTMANDTNPLISISNDYIINKKLTELNYFSLNKDNMKPYLENSVVWIKRGNNDYKTTLLNLADYMIKRLRDNQIIA